MNYYSNNLFIHKLEETISTINSEDQDINKTPYMSQAFSLLSQEMITLKKITCA